MGTQAVRETRGIIATYEGKPINAYFTSTCGGRTEDGENIFDKAEPYLQGVECSLEGHRYFEPFTINTVRQPAKLRDAANLELAQLMSLLASNGFYLSTAEMTDDWFDETPNASEISNWLNQLATSSPNHLQIHGKNTAKPVELARIYSPDGSIRRITPTRC